MAQAAAALAVSVLYLAYQRLTLPYVERLDQVGENISDAAAVGTFLIFLALVLLPNASVATTCAQLCALAPVLIITSLQDALRRKELRCMSNVR